MITAKEIGEVEALLHKAQDIINARQGQTEELFGDSDAAEDFEALLSDLFDTIETAIDQAGELLESQAEMLDNRL
jgi:hypothetical protein